MVISPNSDIILYSGMPLDDTYTDTLYFDTLSAQTSFFQNNNYIKRSFAVNTYQRINEGVFDANCLADEIYDCNYMAFRNTNFGNKWFYAFINRIEYVNNGMARVNFSLDVMQTYLFDAVLEECFVEREHSVTDNIGENILPEPVQLSEYIYDDYSVMNFVDRQGNSVYDEDIVLMLCDVDFEEVSGSYRGNTYMGTKMKAYIGGPLGAMAADEELKNYIQKPDSIVNMYMAPHFVTKAKSDNSGDMEWDSQWDDIVYTVNFPMDYFKYVDGYEVKNKKLFTYPYHYLHVDNSNGSNLSLRFEFFDGLPKFSLIGSAVPPVQLTMFTQNYKGNHNDRPLMTEKLVLDEYPLCSWNYDTYKAWTAQNSVPRQIEGFATLGKAMGSVLSGDIGAGVSQTADMIASMAISKYKASIAADTIRGNIACGNSLYANDRLRFMKARCRQPVSVVKTIDDFFNVYGYNTSRVKIPNRNVRPHWTYTKTSGAKLIGKCPTDALKTLSSIYDSGITFWKNASEVGNYSIDNSPM